MADTAQQQQQQQERPQTNRPGWSAFKNQRLKAWQPILTPQTVLPTFFVVGLLFLPLGIGLFVTSQQVQEVVLDYTQCDQPNGVMPSTISNWTYQPETKLCAITFELATAFTGPVFMYYRLTNFYQNHRRYVKSFSSAQLQGQTPALSALQTDCDPLVTTIDALNNTLPIYPCGLIANSVFNDTLSNLTYVSGSSGTPGSVYGFSQSGIAWPSDKAKFVKTNYQPYEVLPPPNWAKYANTYNVTGIPDISQDEHLMVWMRTAGLPNFRKLYAKSTDTLPAGTYTITVLTQYPVLSFSGTKAVVLSTTSWLGGKNPFLGIAYMVVGSLCLLLGIGFLIRHVVKPRKLGDTSLLSWNRN